VEVLKRKLDQTQTQQSYNRVAWFYDIWSWLTERKAAKAVIDLAEIKDGVQVLEIACGTGIVFEQIVRRNPHGLNIGIDLSPEMLNNARKRLNKCPGNFELQEGDVFNLQFQENTFDIVINTYMVDLMPEETFDKIAHQFYRVLKPNGTAVISTFSFGTKRIHGIWLWIATHFPGLLTGCRPVSFKAPLINAGFNVEKILKISQNTFPSEILKAKKRA
jgi:ubiquinone/menaquinone biosynthesis C-methylase UbiE